MSTGTHRHRCRKETRKRKTHAYHSCGFPTVNCMRMCNVSQHKFKVTISVSTPSQWLASDLSFLFSAPPSPALPKTCTTVRPTPLYRKWSGKNTKSSFHLLFHFPFSHLLFSLMHDFCLWDSPSKKQDVWHFSKFFSQMWWKSIDVSS